MTTFPNIDYKTFRSQAGEFFKATLDRTALTEAQADNGFKALVLLYMGQTDDWAEHEVNEAIIILEMAGKRLFEVELANEGMAA